MSSLSLRWIVASALLVTGGLALAAIPAAALQLTDNIGSDALIFLGAALGGAVAALASRRRAIGEVGLGALLTLAVVVGLLALLGEGASFEYSSAEGRSLFFRRVAVFCVAAMVGAGVGGRRTSHEPIRLKAFWTVCASLATLAFAMLIVGLVIQLSPDSLALGALIVFAAPLFGGFTAQAMAPVRLVGPIALGAASILLFALVNAPSDIGPAAVAGLLCAGVGALGAKIGVRVFNKSDEAPLPMPRAQVQGRE